MDCRTLIAHPKLPILHVLTADGRVLVVAISVKVKGMFFSEGAGEILKTPNQRCFDISPTISEKNLPLNHL